MSKPPKLKVRIQPKSEEIHLSDDTLSRFNDLFNQVGDTLIGRSQEIEALKLCLVTRGHLMLEGLHGTGKSLLAEQVFRRITGSRIFEKQFMKGTQTDEVLGPMLTERYRQGIWEHNIAGMLPDCHFFFADEIYRASDQALPVMFGILNERRFVNAGVVMKCPLVTAIGTTNFVTDSEELDAFHDRWHVRVKVQPLTSSVEVVRMLERAIRSSEEEEEPLSTITLEEILGMHKALEYVQFPEPLLELIPEIASSFSKQMGKVYISDRRKVSALRFIQANALLSGRRTVSEDDFEACRYVFTTVREPAHEQAFSSSVGSIVRNFKSNSEERELYMKLDKHAKALRAQFDDSLTAEEAAALRKKAKKTLEAFANCPDEDRPKSAVGVRILEDSKNDIEKLVSELEESYSF